MAFDDKTFPIVRQHFGNQRARGDNKNLMALSYGYTQQMRRASSTPTVVGATAVSNTGATQLNPSGSAIVLDVPRAVSAVYSGTAGSVSATVVTIIGTNIEGKVITDTITPTAATLGTYNGTRAFKTITSVSVPTQSGTGVSVAIVARNVFGLNHRLPTGTTAANVRIVSVSNVTNLPLQGGNQPTNLGADGIKTLQAQPSTLNVDNTFVELNTFVPATAPDGTFHMTAHYYYVNWVLDPLYDGAGRNTQTKYGVTR